MRWWQCRYAAPTVVALSSTSLARYGVPDCMDRLVKRRYVMELSATAAGLALCIAVTAFVWHAVTSHPGGDPGGRIIAQMTPVVAVVPGFESGRIPWIAFPCDTCKFPAKYAIKIEPGSDSCDGMAGTFGWDPVRIQVGFLWTGSRQSLVDLLSKRLSLRGWARGAAPVWADSSYLTWVSPRGPTANEALELDSPSPPKSHRWMATVEASPQGRLVGNC